MSPLALYVLDLHRLPTPLPAPETLPPDEQHRRQRYLHPIDRDRFLAGRVLARAALARRLGCAPADIKLALSPAGRPEAIAPPGAPPFSLAHSGRLVVLALGSEAVGVDVEASTSIDPHALAPTVLTPAEQRHLAQAGDPAATSACFLRFWTLKEAYTKALGQGLLIDPKSFGFALDPHPSLIPPVPGWHFAEYAPLPDHAMALAWRGAATAPTPTDAAALLQP